MDSFAIVLAEIEQLDASQLSGFAGPNDANTDLYGLRKTVERDGDTSNKIAAEFRRWREQETVLADIKKQALVSFVKGNENRGLRGNARIEATFEACGHGRELLG